MVVIVSNLDLSKGESRNLIKFLETPQQVNTQDKEGPVPSALNHSAPLHDDCWPCLMTWNSFLMQIGIRPYDFHLLLIFLAFKKQSFLFHSKHSYIWYA